MKLHYCTWKMIRKCAFLFALMINIPYIAEMEAFALEEERWSTEITK